MEDAKRFRFRDPDETTPGFACQQSDFVRATDYQAERELRMRSIASLMLRDVELSQARARIEELEEAALMHVRLRELVAQVSSPVINGLDCISDIQRGCNVTTDAIWRACGHLQAALVKLSEIQTLTMQATSERPTVQ